MKNLQVFKRLSVLFRVSAFLFISVIPCFAVDGDLIVNGKVGIGTETPAQKLSVAGTIESTSGGIKFPDGTTQTTASWSKQIFTSPTNTTLTWINPGVTSVIVTLCGGGGGGSYQTSGTGTVKPGSGGGGAGQCVVSRLSVSGNQTYLIGSGGRYGLPGSTSQFASAIYAQGGQPGVTAATATGAVAGGAGGVLGSGILAGGAGISTTPFAYGGNGTVIGGSGGAGGAGASSTVSYGGAGGGGGINGAVPATTTGGVGGQAFFTAGKGGKGGNASGAIGGGGGGGGGYGYGSNGGDGATGTTAGTDGTGYASGGGGGNANALGGNGAPGIIIVEWVQ